MSAAIEDLLREAMGLDAASIGSSAIARAVQQRLAACGLADAGAYLAHVRTDAGEWQELIEAVVVPETWFFRDREAFATCARLAVEEWLPAHPAGSFRALSVPCSTGEEPYSLAMALLEAGFPAERFRIDALDISTRALAAARRAVFGKNSFRGDELGFRDRHFTPAGAGWQLATTVARQVEFRPGNLLESGLALGAPAYDAVFCRNLLIYFDRATQERALTQLTRWLAPSGWLFVGPAETGLVPGGAFVSAKVPLAFAFRRAAAGAPVAPPPWPGPLPAWRPPAPVRATPPAELPFSSVKLRPAAVAEPPLVVSTDLELAMQLADQGRLAEAAQAGEAHLRAHGPSAGVFYVLGLVRDASGRPAEAAAFYRKALYLEPGHREALAHLAFLLEGQGDKAGARILTERARRLEPGPVT